ncbi:MAG: NMD3-related protein [Candidatus Woesearchaeota archaeon]
MAEKPPSYFEGVLQLRGCSDEVLDWAHDEIIRAGRAKIAKVKEVKGGIDVYLSSQHYMQSLGRQLQQRFGGILKITRRIHTRSRITSRDVYRMTVLFRQLPFRKGETISYRGEKWKVLAVGNQVQLQNILSGKKTRVPAGKLVK